MEDNNNTKAMTSVLRLFEEHRQEVEDPSRRDWKWRDGTLLFPEGRCCYCGAPVRSNRLWVVDQGWLRGQLDIEKGVFEKPDHPHAGTDGSLCLGDSNNPVEALFFGINPSDPVMRNMDITKWYAKMFGHVCGSKEAMALKASELFPADCGGREDYDDDDDYECESCCHCCERNCCSDNGVCDCGCNGCYCVTTNCFKCEQPIGDDYAQVHDEDHGYRWHCHNCWSATHSRCVRCMAIHPTNTVVALDSHEGMFCPYCAGYMQRYRRAVIVAATAPAVPVITPETVTIAVNTTDSGEVVVNVVPNSNDSTS